MGGAAGHINHPYHDRLLTFKQLKDIGIRALEGRLAEEKPITEKVDGLQLQITFKDGKIKAARNKKQLITPLTVDEFKALFEDRGVLQDAFVYAIQDLNSAIGQLPDNFIKDFFKDGARFISLEILYPPVQNVIPYGEQPYIQFHNVVEYDLNGSSVGVSITAVKKLAQALINASAQKQKTYVIGYSKPIKLSKVDGIQDERTEFMTKLNKLQKEFNLQDNSTLLDYYRKWWENYINEQHSELSKETRNKLILRWADEDKSDRLLRGDFETVSEFEKMKEFEKTTLKDLIQENEEKFELIFLELGIKVLQTATDYLSTVPNKTYIKELLDRIKAVKKELDNLEEVSRAYHELTAIRKLGGIKNAVPIEGVVFVFDGKLFKLTGLFAPLNQLLGFFRYSRVER